MNVMKNRCAAAIKNERGMALVITLLLLLLVTALGIAAIAMSMVEMSVSGGYYHQRQSELSTDAGVELAEAMIFANTTSTLPGVATENGFLPPAVLSNWSTFHRPITYKDNELNLQYTIKYKTTDNVNYFTPVSGESPHPDHWVRYGWDYQYDAPSCAKAVGTQAVYTVTVTDNNTGAQSKADMVTTPGFIDAGAVFVRGNVYAMKWGLATDERIELVSTTPSLPAIAMCSGNTLYLQNIANKSSSTTSECATAARGNLNEQYNVNTPPASLGYGSTLDYAYAASQVIGTDGNNYVCIKTHTPSSSTKPITGASWSTYWAKVTNPVYMNGYVNPITGRAMYPSTTWQSSLPNGEQYMGSSSAATTPFGYWCPDVYTAADIAAEPNPLVQHDMYFILTQSGSDCNPAHSNVINTSYSIPSGGDITKMMGCSFSDYSAVADAVIPNASYPALSNQTVPNDTGGTKTANNVIDMSSKTFGSMTQPEILYIKSNMNASGAYISGATPVILSTQSNSQMNGTGILVINGDAEIIGSINWTGVMIVRGNLLFRPWQGGDWCSQSGPTLSSKWDGLIMVGGDLNLLTLAGGSIFLGQYTPLPTIQGMLSAGLPHKLLGWQRIYK